MVHWQGRDRYLAVVYSRRPSFDVERKGHNAHLFSMCKSYIFLKYVVTSFTNIKFDVRISRYLVS